MFTSGPDVRHSHANNTLAMAESHIKTKTFGCSAKRNAVLSDKALPQA